MESPPTYTSSKVVLILARVSFREGGPQRRLVVHCALAASAAGVFRERWNFLLLQEAGTISDTVFAKYATQAPIRTARCLPFFRQEPTVGVLRQFRVDDVVAHIVSIWESGPIKSVTVFELKHTQVGGDGFALGKAVADVAPSVDDAPDDGLSLIGLEASRHIRRRRQHRRVRQELQPSRTLSPVTSTILITLPKSDALARTRSSKFKTCLRMSKMSSPRRHNRSSPKMQRHAIPAYHATPTTSAAPHFSYTNTEHMSGATAMPPEPLSIAQTPWKCSADVGATY